MVTPDSARDRRGIRVLPFGRDGLLAEVDTLEEVLALHAALVATRPAGVVDLVPAARTVLVHVDPARLGLAAARAWIAGADLAMAGPDAAATEVDLPIVYDGADLADLAARLGLTRDALAGRHAAGRWTVAFTGFAPGFGYLVGDDWPFDVPRLAAPRTRVPAGSVGLAGAFSGAYPRETPGGWQLIGTTPATLFDPTADPPALLAPGTRVRFTPVRAASSGAVAARPAAAAAATAAPTAPPAARGLEVLAPGLRATVQDLGRAGHLAEGVAVSGAADPDALRTANRLVGNREDAAVVEVTLGGFRARALDDLWIAVAGAWGPVALDGRAVDPYVATPWRRGEVLDIDWAAHGTRAYLAVRGGVDAPAAVGSRATDTLSGLGPPPLAPGAVLAAGDAAIAPIPALDVRPWMPPRDDDIVVEVAPGPRADWFTPAARRTFLESDWTVSGDADRVGIRLDGPHLERAREGELPSEGMLPGAVQVPPAGRPVVLGVDGPVTGGYPVIAVVTAAGRAALAQARPGTRVRFRAASTTL